MAPPAPPPAPAPPAAPGGRTDAVAALLGRVWDDALDPGYAAAASRRTVARPEGPPPGTPVPRRHRRSLGAGLSLALVGLVLAAAAVEANVQRPVVEQRRAELLADVAEQTDRNDALAAGLAALRAEVDGLEIAGLGATAEGERLADQLVSLGARTGTAAVRGPGVAVTLDDAEPGDPALTDDPALGRVLDRDLQLVVNGLWAAGAEAVSVNDQRLTSLSAIRAAGEAILVDYRPLARPYVVQAIGDPDSLAARFVAGPGGRGLQTLGETYGIRHEVSGVEEMTLPAASAVTLRYARPEGAEP